MSPSLTLSSSFFILALIATCALVDHSDACAPTSGGSMTTAKPKPEGGRRKRSVDEDVQVIVTSSEPFDLSKAAEHMVTVEKKLKDFADAEGISFKQLQELPRTAENVGGKFSVHFTVEGAFDKCARVLQFIQAAANEVTEVVSGTVKCGAFEAVHVSRKVTKVHDNKIEEHPDGEKAEEVKSPSEQIQL